MGPPVVVEAMADEESKARTFSLLSVRQKQLEEQVLLIEKKKASLEEEVLVLAGQMDKKAREKYDERVREGEAKKEELIGEGRAGRDAVLDEGRKEGCEIGRKEGQAEGLNEIRLISSKLEEVLNSAVTERQKILEEAKGDIISLVKFITGKVIKKQVSEDEEVIVRVVSGAIAKILEEKKITVRVHPDDYNIAESRRGEFFSIVNSLDQIDFIMDKRIDRGGCIIETAFGNIDARISSQLDFIDMELRRSVKGDL
ncbi:MAG: hypothetical protein A2X49_09780 [Lentisphaerae bacterium GWF2_52_8]|nr:MAG: hypothetical protein A2X49_09780 [Lentisphaerae bacterium GWF2_52_8]